MEAIASKECICPKKCDCEKPPPPHWDGKEGSWLISEHCPEHNWNPMPDPDCLAEHPLYESSLNR